MPDADSIRNIRNPSHRNFTAIAVDGQRPNILYVALSASAFGHRETFIYRSVDRGSTWEPFIGNIGPYSNVFGGLAVNPHNGEVHVSTSHGNFVLEAP